MNNLARSSLLLVASLLTLSCSQQAASTFVPVASPPQKTATSQAVAPQTQTIQGKVVAIADGDTLTVLDASNTQHRIRLQGIDAPESRQAFGNVSRQHLASLVFGKQVTVEYDKKDFYKRTLGKVIVEGRDANLEQIKSGMAWHYKFYQNEQPPEDRKAYAQAEVEARAAQGGLWSDPNPIPPWDFRRGRRSRRGDTEELGGGTTTAPPVPRTDVPRSTDGCPTIPVREPEADTVYITRTGEKYHRLSCRYLRRSRIPVALKDAKQNYSPCSVCQLPE